MNNFFLILILVSINPNLAHSMGDEDSAINLICKDEDSSIQYIINLDANTRTGYIKQKENSKEINFFNIQLTEIKNDIFEGIAVKKQKAKESYYLKFEKNKKGLNFNNKHLTCK